MSRSRRKTPIFGNAIARSEKEDKRISSGIFRARARVQIANEDEVVIEKPREALNPYSMSKDGKNYWLGAGSRHMRK